MKRTTRYKRTTVLEASRLLILTALSLLPAFAGAQVTVGRGVQHEIRVISEVGNSAATLSVTQVQTVLPGGKIVDGSFIGLFNPSSRLFWWGYQSSLGASNPEAVMKEYLDWYTFSVHPDQIVCWIANGRMLQVRTSEMRASSMNEGVSKARVLLPEQLSKGGSGATMWSQHIPLAGAVGQTFLNPKEFGDPGVGLKISAVHRSNSGWTIEIKNDRGESKTVLLSRDFKTATGTSQ